MAQVVRKIEESKSFSRWVRPPQQARTREGLVRLLDAAETLIAEHGFENASIAEIARQADSSVGAVYRRFRDKQGLLLALHERFCEEARATTDDTLAPARWEGASAATIVDEFTGQLVHIFRERRGLFLAFQARAMVDPAVRDRWQQLFEHIGKRLGELLRRRWSELRHHDPDLAIKFALQSILGLLTYSLRTGVETIGLSDARLVTELSRLFKTYTGIDDGTDDRQRRPRQEPQT
jgi:AcrR family transcriptional regulator